MRLPAPTLFLALAFAAPIASAQPHDWPALARVKPGATIVVYTHSAVGDARCILLQVDASALTCSAAGSPATRFVYPASQIDEVYQVKHPHLTFGIILALILSGTLIGGLASGNGPAIGVGLLGLLIALIVTAPPLPWGIYAPPPRPNPPAERMVLVYRSAVTP